MKSTSMEVPFFTQDIKLSDHCVDMNDPGYFLLILETLAPELVPNQFDLIAFCTPNSSHKLLNYSGVLTFSS